MKQRNEKFAFNTQMILDDWIKQKKRIQRIEFMNIENKKINE